GHEIRVKECSPRFTRVAARGIVMLWNRQLLKLDGIRFCREQPLTHATLFHEPANQRAFAPVDARLQPRVITHRHEARLYASDRTVLVLADEDVAIVDVHPHHASGGS